MTQDTQKTQAIAAIVGQMKAHGITPGELKKAMAEEGGAPDKGDLASRLFSILGGIFIFAGVGIYIATFWEDMNSAARILSTLGAGLALYALALAALPRGRYRRAIPALLLVGLVLQTTGWFVTLGELFDHGRDVRYAVLFVMAVMGVQQAAVFSRYRLTLLLFATILFAYGFAVTLLDLMGVDEELVAAAIGISMMALAQHLRAGAHGSLSGLGYFIGGICFYFGLFELVEGTPLELLYFASTIGLIYLSTVVRSASLLMVSTIAMLCYIGYFTAEHFANSVGWPVALILLGGAFIAISGYAWKLKKKYM